MIFLTEVQTASDIPPFRPLADVACPKCQSNGVTAEWRWAAVLNGPGVDVLDMRCACCKVALGVMRCADATT